MAKADIMILIHQSVRVVVVVRERGGGGRRKENETKLGVCVQASRSGRRKAKSQP